MAEQIQGKITQIIGAVLDIKFPEGMKKQAAFSASDTAK